MILPSKKRNLPPGVLCYLTTTKAVLAQCLGSSSYKAACNVAESQDMAEGGKEGVCRRIPSVDCGPQVEPWRANLIIF